MMKTSAAVLLLSVLLLAACGGGGGSSGGGGGSTPGPFDPGPRDPLPAPWTSLDYYFSVELVKDSLSMPVKLAQAPMPDGRLFVNLLGGQIITIDATAPHTQTTWANISVVTGVERGLLGIALSPQFATDGYVFVVACVPHAGGDRQQVIRLQDSGGVGINPTVIVDNLPMASIHNAGAIKFLLDGTFVISIGDANNAADAQADGSLAGRILRYNANGSVPSNNPFTGNDEFEWCRGLRNTFGLCVHPTLGLLLGTDNEGNSGSFAMADELNYLVAGRNYEWGAPAGTIPGAQVGIRLWNWPALVVPTGLTYHSGNNFPSGYADNLFICSYDDVRILRWVMDGSPPVNVDTQHIFGAMNPTGNDNKPLDIIEGVDGSLYVSTFTALWRIYRRTGP